MDIREDAHRLLDELDEDQVATAAELLRDLVRQRRPLDDEPAAPSQLSFRRNVYGYLAGRVPDVSADEIADERRETWGDLADGQ